MGEWLDETPMRRNTVALTVRESSGLRCLARLLLLLLVVWVGVEEEEGSPFEDASDFFRVLERRKLAPVSNLDDEVMMAWGIPALPSDEAVGVRAATATG
jgi:hypothetical protein